jgi:hypothetical protein
LATFQVVDEFANFLGKKRDDLSADTFKAVLSNTAPTKAGTQVLADITQIAATGGYAAVTLTGVTWTETAGGSGIWAFTSAAFSWTASGADFATARYVGIYDDTSTNDDVVGYLDIASFTLANGSTLTITPGANGIFRATVS